jgi:hypothetical protein
VDPRPLASRHADFAPAPVPLTACAFSNRQTIERGVASSCNSVLGHCVQHRGPRRWPGLRCCRGSNHGATSPAPVATAGDISTPQYALERALFLGPVNLNPCGLRMWVASAPRASVATVLNSTQLIIKYFPGTIRLAFNGNNNLLRVAFGSGLHNMGSMWPRRPYTQHAYGTGRLGRGSSSLRRKRTRVRASTSRSHRRR